MTRFRIIGVDSDAASFPVTQRIVAAHPEAEVRTGAWPPGETFGVAAKSVLRLRRHRGSFLKSWRTGPGSLDANRFYLAQGIGCLADCAYCFLQSYHADMVPTYRVNLEEMRAEVLARFTSGMGGHVLAGELVDSLFLDGATGLSRIMHELARSRPGIVVELRTKDAGVETLREVSPLPNLVVAWTMSPETVVQRYEEGTASFEERLAAARRVASWGHPVGLRFDPVIRVPAWREEYGSLMERIAAVLDLDRLEKIVLGLLRFSPSLPACVMRRRGRSALFVDEFVRCHDGKMRYVKFVRVEMLSFLLEKAMSCFPGIPIELAMETPEVHDLVRRQTGEGILSECCVQ